MRMGILKIKRDCKKMLKWSTIRSGPIHYSERINEMGETLNGLEAIANHFNVEKKKVLEWISKGLPHGRDGEKFVVSVAAAEEWLNQHKEIFGGNFSVQIIHNNEVVWAHGERDGFSYGTTCHGYYEDGTIEQIQAALNLALNQVSYQPELTVNNRV